MLLVCPSGSPQVDAAELLPFGAHLLHLLENSDVDKIDQDLAICCAEPIEYLGQPILIVNEVDDSADSETPYW